MNQRKIGTMLSYVHIIVTNTISLIYTPYMLRMMGQSEYGLYGTASSLISYLSILSFGIGGAYIRFNAQARATGDKEEERRLNGMFLIVFSVLAFLVFVFGMVFILFAEVLVQNTFSSEELFKLQIIMFILVVNMMVTFVCNVFMMALQAYEQFFVIRITLLIAGILQPMCNVIALNLGGKAIVITLISFVISVLSYCIMIVYARKVIRFEIVFSGFEIKKFKDLFVFSGFLFLNSITDQITFSTDSIVLSSVRGTSAVAVYTVGAQFKNYFQNFTTSVSSVFAPQINQIVANKGDMHRLDELFQKVGRIQFYIVALVIIGYCSIGRDFIILWAGKEYVDAFYIGLLLILSVTIPSFQNISIEIQKAKNMHKTRSVVYFLIALFNICLTIPLSIKWSGIGAATATMFCMVIGYTIFMNIYNYRCVGIDIPAFWNKIISILPGCIVPILAGILINCCYSLNKLSDVLVAAFIICVVFCVSIWNLSMNDFEKDLIRKPFSKIIKKYNVR